MVNRFEHYVNFQDAKYQLRENILFSFFHENFLVSLDQIQKDL